MPPTTAPKPKPKPAPKGDPAGKAGAKAGKGLGKRIGPFPLWLWVGAGVGVAIIAYLYLRGGGGGGDYSAVETVTGSGGSAPQDAASAGQPSQNGTPAAGLDPGVLQDLIDQQALGFSAIQDSIASGFESQAGYLEQAAYDAVPPADATEAVVTTTLGSPGSSIRKAKPKIAGKNTGRGVYRDRQGRLTYKGPKRPAAKPAGKNFGRGVYRDAQGRLTYKGPAKPKKQSSRSVPRTKAPAKPKPVATRTTYKSKRKPVPKRKPGRR